MVALLRYQALHHGWLPIGFLETNTSVSKSLVTGSTSCGPLLVFVSSTTLPAKGVSEIIRYVCQPKTLAWPFAIKRELTTIWMVLPGLNL